MLRLRVVLAVVLGLAAVALPVMRDEGRSAAAAAGSPTPAVGVQFHGTWSSYTDAQRATVLDRLAAAHVGWVRIDMGWCSFQPTGPADHDAWYTGLADSSVNMAAARGLKVLATLWCTPGWANGGQARSVPPADPATYATFANWAAAHFKGRVAAWEVWNEPNLTDFWAGADASKYASLVKATYPQVKAGDPGALVVAGSVSENDTPWLSRMYDAGAGGSFDVLSTHPYQAPSDGPPELADDGNVWIMDHVRTVHDLMVSRGDGAKPIWATEFGWSSHTNTGSEPNWNLGVSLSTQADYLTRSLSWFAANHPYVTNVFWYTERNSSSGSVQEDNYGLLNTDLTPKPALTALASYLGGSGGSGSTSTTSTTSSTTSTTSTSTTSPTVKTAKGRGNSRH